jgi:hypothetical protein
LSLSGASNTRIPDLAQASSLVSLDISRCVKLLEASARVALMQMTALQQLSISGITNFLDQTLMQVRACCAWVVTGSANAWVTGETLTELCMC